MGLKMKRKYFTSIAGVMIIFLFVIHSSLIAQTGWYPLQSGTTNVLKSVYFVDAFTGYMAGEGIILKSTNAGNNWLVINNTYGGRAIQFINAETGYVCDGTIYKTINGGISWQNLGLTSLNGIFFHNDNSGYAVGKNDQIIKTTDGGATWDIQSTGDLTNKFNSVIFLNESVGFAIGGRSTPPYYGIIYKTTNGGAIWNAVFTQGQDVDFRGVDFVNDYTGYAVGGNEIASNGVIYRTTNAGETWQQQGIVYRDLNSVFFSTPSIGYTVGEDGIILKTVNGGAVWNTQVSTTTEDINSVYFLRENLGYTVGNSGVVQKTVNGGTPGPPFAIAGRVFFTGGQNVGSGVVRALRYNSVTNLVEIVDEAIIELNGDYILRNITQDSVDIMAFPNDEDEDNPLPPRFVPTYYGGNNTPTINWVNSKTLYPTGNLFNINVTVYPTVGNGGTGIIGGGVYNSPPNVTPLPGSIVYAMSGNDFKGYSVSRTPGIYDINNLSQGNYRVICDRFGYRSAEKNITLGSVNLDTVNFYLIGIGVIGIQPNGGVIPSTYKLEQNYPNPFNPVTNIKVDIPKASVVKLAVYDMLGRELEVLVNENLQAGSYKVSWNALKYSSGIYFYKVISSDFVETKKMILVK
jgi:photosystem II stability/assembly factor-like uncharacterized protein